MIPYSVLDLSPIAQGQTASDALRHSGELAAHAERLGYTRYWLAEHHNSRGIASAATALVIGHVASKTSTIRVGSGGIMLPNHAPLMVAEAFGTLHALYGDRIDLGVGRAPGTDPRTMQALRRGLEADRFPEDVVELIGFLGPVQEGQPVMAVPGAGSNIPVWILGSSLYGAQLAAHLGLPYAFASHFAPDALDQAVQIYRERFQPGLTEKPHFMLALNLFAAETDAEAHLMRSSMMQGFVNLRRGQTGPLPAPVADLSSVASEPELRQASHQLSMSAVGSPETVERQLAAYIARYRPDEVILNGQIFDHQARLKSFEIGAKAMQNLAKVAA
ncbi:LLM class flavin-dependent oxidoreductase [Thioclava litoralis]|uniref:LLM class flavin-dependent oxidoreductase n=1 Tax=Thioclava litoralis TaxID=3076557 RepID=A0ABZ1DY66_9RHOB|nr:LLM class flavin-dependent oxidoreductase [Thioclava sp. FTW29]